MAHITGGGLPDNLPRVLPAGLGAHIKRDSWTVPPVFSLIQTRGDVSEEEMYQVFNMGAGFVFVVSSGDAAAVADVCPEPVFEVGRVVEGEGVTFV